MILILTLILFTLGIIIAAAVTDFLYLRIPNIIPIIVSGAFFITWGTASLLNIQISTHSFTSHLIIGVISLCVMVALFYMKFFGGGDAKLIPAVALWVGLSGLPVFLMVTSIIGGVLAVISLTLRRTKWGIKTITDLNSIPLFKNSWIGRMAQGSNEVPYGIAIAAGGIAAFISSGLLP